MAALASIDAIGWLRKQVDGRREVLGLDVVTAEDGAGWLAFLRSLRFAACGGGFWHPRDRDRSPHG
jgi:putative transposase